MKTFALADPSDPTKVRLWCSDRSGGRKKDERRFSVINGAWKGVFYPKRNELFVVAIKTTHPAILVWEGEALFRTGEYNAAIAWIEQQLADAPQRPNQLKPLVRQ